MLLIGILPRPRPPLRAAKPPRPRWRRSAGPTSPSVRNRRAGGPLRRILTDGGSEFKAAFAAACEVLGITHTRIVPGHAWTNGFVERLQGTILHEHWRIEFRRRYFTGRVALQRSLEAFMRFYNERRPHQGYRLRGRTSPDLFWGATVRS